MQEHNDNNNENTGQVHEEKNDNDENALELKLNDTALIDNTNMKELNKERDSNHKSTTLTVFVVIIILLAIYIFYAQTKPEYKDALVAIEDGKLIEAYIKLEQLGDYKDSLEMRAKLQEEIYENGINFYRNNELDKAVESFSTFPEYKRTDDYLNLILETSVQKFNFGLSMKIYNSGAKCSKNDAREIVLQIMKDLDFENSKEVIANSLNLENYLEGTWETVDGYYLSITNLSGSYSYDYNFETGETSGGPKWNTSSNLPMVYGKYYKIENGTYFVGSDEEGWTEQLKFTIKSINEMDVYCYKDIRTYVMRRM